MLYFIVVRCRIHALALALVCNMKGKREKTIEEKCFWAIASITLSHIVYAIQFIFKYKIHILCMHKYVWQSFCPLKRIALVSECMIWTLHIDELCKIITDWNGWNKSTEMEMKMFIGINFGYNIFEKCLNGTWAQHTIQWNWMDWNSWHVLYHEFS